MRIAGIGVNVLSPSCSGLGLSESCAGKGLDGKQSVLLDCKGRAQTQKQKHQSTREHHRLRCLVEAQTYLRWGLVFPSSPMESEPHKICGEAHFHACVL